MSKVYLRKINANEDIRDYINQLVTELEHILENIDEENMTEKYVKSIKEDSDEL